MSSQSPDRLRRFTLFESLQAEELHALAKHLTLRKLAAEERLFVAGDPGTSAYFVEQGRLVALLRTAHAVEVLEVFEPGMLVGELCLVEPSVRSADLKALDPAELLELDRAGLEALRGESPTAAVKIVREISRLTCARIRAANARIEAYLGADLRGTTERPDASEAPAHPPELPDLPPLPDGGELHTIRRIMSRIWS